ncbi:pentapeptide repeat-containing protein [Dietzia maris]|uniref:pentapeptide repeat-containing protein n=1 Tax=Dietzia maris TaxID=37915 RepID=UPI00344118E1
MCQDGRDPRSTPQLGRIRDQLRGRPTMSSHHSRPVPLRRHRWRGVAAVTVAVASVGALVTTGAGVAGAVHQYYPILQRECIHYVPPKTQYDYPVRPSDCRGANLAGANLAGARLPGVNLNFANLSGADLSGANPCQAPGFVEGGYLASTRSSTGFGAGSTAACWASYSAGGT